MHPSCFLIWTYNLLVLCTIQVSNIINFVWSAEKISRAMESNKNQTGFNYLPPTILASISMEFGGVVVGQLNFPWLHVLFHKHACCWLTFKSVLQLKKIIFQQSLHKNLIPSDNHEFWLAQKSSHFPFYLIRNWYKEKNVRLMLQCFVKDINYARRKKIEKDIQLECKPEGHSCYGSKPKTSYPWSLYESHGITKSM